jgi:enoyl-CoA hydratase
MSEGSAVDEHADQSIVVTQTGAVRRITLNRPAKLNAMDAQMQLDFFSSIDDAMADRSVTVTVVAGAGRAFSSGADLRAAVEPAQANDVRNAPSDMVANRSRVDRWLRLWSAPKPIIAQVHGYCIGIANEVVGACDLVVCAESAKFGMPEVRDIALPPTLGFWPSRMGPAMTKELLFTGRWLTGAEAVERGLANRVVPEEQLESVVDELAAQIAEVPSARLTVVKQAVNAWEESAGLRTAALRGADYHAIYHQVSEWGGSNDRDAHDRRG